jgi:UDP-N-acetylmuramate--alanine ligase
MGEVGRMFDIFAAQVREALIVGDGEELRALRVEGGPEDTVFGFAPGADVRGENVELEGDASRFEVHGTAFRLPVPGRHNVENALAAIAACRAVGVPCAEMIEPLSRFAGVTRRFQTIGVARGVEVIDDFAHNPSKIAASIDTAHRRAKRVLAVFQPHGYGPTRFLRPDLVKTFATSLGADDRLWLLEVFYAGGTAKRDFSAADIVQEIAAQRIAAEFVPTRDALIARIVAEARAGDVVLVMGARDPSLTELAHRLVEALESGTTADAKR